MNKFNLNDLKKSSKNLTNKYKTAHQTLNLNQNEHFVYLKSRMPATLAVCTKVLEQINKKSDITSLLDLGAGPGSATYAALKIFSNLTTIHLIDRDNNYSYNFDKPYKFFKQEFTDVKLTQLYDLIIISYALSECEPTLFLKILQESWKNTNKNLVIIEPGTPFGYSSWLKAREYLINQGASIVAPCPHKLKCPLADGDWCHFKIRLQRSKIHQQIKQGTKSFEDQSYIFGIFSKEDSNNGYDRIIKRPIKGSGHILFDLCTDKGQIRKIISRKEKEYYIRAKKLEWGDQFL